MDKVSLISVIVPVYKVEAYLDKCISSIVNQTYKNLEIILVDDGSSDNCPAMCDAWAAKDSRIIVIHQTNSGSGAARNAGLSIASGEFISFIDSDDYLLPDMLDTLYSCLIQTGVDIAECGYYQVHSSSALLGDKSTGDIRIFSTEEALLNNIEDSICRQLVWNKLYKRSTISDARFIAGKFIDDEFWTYRVLGNATKVAVIDKKLYCYRQQGTSIMHQDFSLRRLDALEAKVQRTAYIKANFPQLFENAKRDLCQSCIYAEQMVLLNLKGQEKADGQAIIMAVWNDILDVHMDSPKQKFWLVMAKASLPLTAWLRNVLHIGW